jgi:hypothetical protein
LTPDSTKQKYAQTVVSTRIVPGCLQFLGEEKRFYTAWVKAGSRRNGVPRAGTIAPKLSGLRRMAPATTITKVPSGARWLHDGFSDRHRADGRVHACFHLYRP